jgi:hypothetical protein
VRALDITVKPINLEVEKHSVPVSDYWPKPVTRTGIPGFLFLKTKTETEYPANQLYNN